MIANQERKSITSSLVPSVKYYRIQYVFSSFPAPINGRGQLQQAEVQAGSGSLWRRKSCCFTGELCTSSTIDSDMQNKKNKKQKVESTDHADAAHLPAGLDFFGSSAAAGPSSTKNKTNKPAKVKVEETSDEESEEESQSAPAIAPPSQKISLSGPEPLPRSFTSFEDLVPLSHSALVRNLRKDSITQLWGVQGAVSGAFMAEEKRDVLVIAPTGSGKTLSYLLPLALKLDQPCRIAFNTHKKGQAGDAGEQGIRSLILVPTHELALQIHGEVQKLLAGSTWRTLLLEKSTESAIITSSQAGQLGIDVLVATPERLHAMIEAGRIDMKG